MKINSWLWLPSFLTMVMLSTFLSLAHSEDYNMDERINPSPVEQIPTGYNLDLIADYSPVKSIDNNIEPASNLIIDPDPAKAAQYEANVFSQETTKLYQQKTSSAPEDSTNYKLDVNGNLLFERIKKDSQASHPAEN